VFMFLTVRFRAFGPSTPIPVRRLFAVVSILVLFLAAGLAVQCVSFLAQADVLPILGDGLWDTSFLLSEGSIPGKILHTLICDSARPSGIQLVAWIVTIVAISVAMWLIRKRRNAAVVAAVVMIGMMGLVRPAAADLQVRLPYANGGTWSLSTMAWSRLDPRARPAIVRKAIPTRSTTACCRGRRSSFKASWHRAGAST
jgi:hypothetical protein